MSSSRQPFFGSLTDLLTWSYEPTEDDPWIPSVDLPHRARTAGMDRRRKLLVCHDMMGGYTIEDAAPNGFTSTASVGEPLRATAFTLHHTALIDSFIYFSHHRVTVPPPQWTNLVHRCGSLALGTLIFEWGESLADLMLFMYGDAGLAWYHAFEMRPHKQYPLPPLPDTISFDICDRIVAFTLRYKLDGWLLNIEVPLPGGSRQAVDLIHLTAYLESQLKQRIGSHAQLIWYDSVTTEGKLQWQDHLSALNAPFFHVASSIFVNYTYGPLHVQVSSQRANSRRHDVYMGIDVFGRNMLGGGGIECRLPQQIASWAGVSTALFAPGWVYESTQEDAMGGRPGWMEVEHELWSRLALEWVDARSVGRPFYADDQDQFNTFFGGASGEFFALDGLIVQHGFWANHSLQSPLPFLAQPGVTLHHPDAFFGGSCVSLDTSTTLTLPFAPVTVHSDSVLALVFKLTTTTHEQPPSLSSISCTLYDPETSGPVSFRLALSSESSTPIGDAGWRIVTLRLGDLCLGSNLRRHPIGPRRWPHLACVRIHSADQDTLLLGQLALHRTSLACDIDTLATSLGALLEDKFSSESTQSGWLMSTRSQLPQGTPLMAFSQPEEGRQPHLLRVWVQGDPWDSVHEAYATALAGDDGDLGKVKVEWWPFWRTLYQAQVK